MKNRESYIARRRFLCGMLGGGTAALSATAVGPLAAYVGNLRSEPLPEFRVIKDLDLAPGQSKIVPYGPVPALLLKTPGPEAALKVFLAICTHFDCIVGYKPKEHCIFCACHEGRFDLEGKVLSGPPPAPLTTFYHTFKGEDLVIALEEENLGKAFETTQ